MWSIFIVPIIIFVVVPLAIIIPIVVVRTKKNKQFEKDVVPFIENLREAGFRVNEKKKYIAADDTTVYYKRGNIQGDPHFSGYFYHHWLGYSYVSVYIYSGSERNQNELEKIIKIFKSTKGHGGYGKADKDLK